MSSSARTVILSAVEIERVPSSIAGCCPHTPLGDRSSDGHCEHPSIPNPPGLQILVNLASGPFYRQLRGYHNQRPGNHVGNIKYTKNGPSRARLDPISTGTIHVLFF